MKVQVSMDEHMQALDWLDAHVEFLIGYSLDDVKAMVEQVTAQ